MSNQLRKIRRNRAKSFMGNYKKEIAKNIKNKMNMFNRIPDNCTVCNKDYDKTNREMAMSWRVFVKKDEVRLYCPECFGRAESLVQKIKENEDVV